MPYFQMSTLALKWAFRRPATRRYPFEPRRALPGSRGQLAFEKSTCVYCGVCSKKCPTGALLVKRKEKQWAIDRLLCVSCNYCVEICPKKSLALSTDHGIPVVTKDREFH